MTHVHAQGYQLKTCGQTERIFDIADVPFSQVSDHEKQEYEAKITEVGSYQGYKPRKFWVRTRFVCETIS